MPPPLHVVQPPEQWQGTFRVSFMRLYSHSLLVSSHWLCCPPMPDKQPPALPCGPAPSSPSL
jgi:hypothetical protein